MDFNLTSLEKVTTDFSNSYFYSEIDVHKSCFRSGLMPYKQIISPIWQTKIIRTLTFLRNILTNILLDAAVVKFRQ